MTGVQTCALPIFHGSNEPETMGQAVSSGCIRMANDDVIDLYARVRVGTKVIIEP